MSIRPTKYSENELIHRLRAEEKFRDFEDIMCGTLFPYFEDHFGSIQDVLKIWTKI